MPFLQCENFHTVVFVGTVIEFKRIYFITVSIWSMINYAKHASLEAWAKKFGGTAMLGFICTLLIAGKFLHHAFQQRGYLCGYLIVPPALISGILGLIWFSIMEKVDPEMTSVLGNGLEGVKVNLINFVFAALILGFTCNRTSSKHSSCRGVVTSLLHEGMPMAIYSQILMWGQSTCCLALACLLRYYGINIPSLFAAMIPLGIEGGEDILDNATFDNNWSRTVAEEAESLGLLAACVASILLLSGKPLLFSCGWLDCGASSRDATAFHYGAGQAEAFERSVKRPISKSLSSSNVNLIQGGADLHDHSKYFGDKEDNAKTGHASLGAHISLIALTVFLSFGVGLFSRLIEMEFGIDNNILSGVRMFKLAMCCALFSMQFILSRTRLRFRRDWFMRLCGLMLDLLIISALSTSYPRPKALESTHYVTCGTFVVLCILWNMFCLVYIAPKVFPNFWFSRALTLTSDALGHSYTGLLFARTFDPNMESPVPAAYAYKLMLFFIPSPGVKNSIIVSIVSIHGPGWAFVICLCIVVAWYLIYDTHFRERFVPAVRKKSKSSLINSRHSSVDHSVDDPLINVLSFDHHDVDGGEDECLDESGHNSVGDQDANPTLGIGRRVGSSGHSLNEKSNSNSLWRNNLMAPANKIQTSEPSSILSPEQFAALATLLPETCKISRIWNLNYCLRRDGASLETLMTLCSMKDRHGNPMHSNCVMIIEDSWGYIFGGYIAHALEKRTSYYGTGESFVFTLAPICNAYRWTGENNFFVMSNNNNFAMGGGGDGFAFQLDDELDTGVSNHSATFNNKQLSSMIRAVVHMVGELESTMTSSLNNAERCKNHTSW